MNWKYYKRWNDIEEILAAFRRWKREDTEKNMKRIKAACITQTIHFINKDITKSEYSKRKVQEEITRYKHRLYSITIFKKTNVHKIFTKKELYPIFLVDMGSLFPSYLLKSPSFDGKMMEIFLS